MARLVSLAVLTTLIVFLGLTFFHVISPFLLPLFLAGVLAVFSQPLLRRFTVWTRNRPSLAAGLTTVSILGMILVPIVGGTVAASFQLYSIAQNALGGADWKHVVEVVQQKVPVDELLAQYEELTGNKVTLTDVQQQVQTRLRQMSLTVAQKTFGAASSTLSFLGDAAALLVSALTFVIALYYFLADGPALLEASVNLVPLHRDYQRQLLTQFDQAVRAVVLATFAAALGQGIATGIGMYVVGFYQFPLLTMIATVMALIPMLGTWLVWGVGALWLGWNGHWWEASLLAIYGAVFVGFLDNVIRSYVLHSNVKLHPLLAFVSVLGGLQVLGLWGVFIGPIVASCLHALVKIFNTELAAFSAERSGLAEPAGALRQEMQPAWGLAGIGVSAPPPAETGRRTRPPRHRSGSNVANTAPPSTGASDAAGDAGNAAPRRKRSGRRRKRHREPDAPAGPKPDANGP